MDPITYATVTSALTVLGNQVATGVAREGGKDLWGRVKALFGWSAEDTPVESLAERIATILNENPALIGQALALLESDQSGTAGKLVGSISAHKVVVIQNNSGDLNF